MGWIASKDELAAARFQGKTRDERREKRARKRKVCKRGKTLAKGRGFPSSMLASSQKFVL
jgi:hypothetical protein